MERAAAFRCQACGLALPATTGSTLHTGARHMPSALVSGCRMHGVLTELVSGLLVACHMPLELTGSAMGRPQKAGGFSEPPRSGNAASAIMC